MPVAGGYRRARLCLGTDGRGGSARVSATTCAPCRSSCATTAACRLDDVEAYHDELAAQRDALDIEGLGKDTSRLLVDRGLVHDLADLYGLGFHDIETLPGFADTSARKLVAAIDGAREPASTRFLYAPGIRHVGLRVAGSKRECAEEAGMEIMDEDDFEALLRGSGDPSG
jgi:hypothetical protein